MSEPVMCPSCGESYGGYPAGGKCPKCGGVVPAPAGRSAKGIDEEIARLDGPPKSCPTCGKPLPAGRRTCPECSRVEPVRPHRHVAGWVSLLIVVIFAAVAGTGTVIYMKKWAHKEHQTWVEDDIQKAQGSAEAGKFGDAIIALDQAQKQLSWFEDEDLTRADLASQIERERNTLRQKADQKIRELLKQGEELEAESFYNNEGLAALDVDSSLRELVKRAVEARKTVLGYRTALKQAQKSYQDGQFTEALREITALRTQVADPYRARGEGMAEIRTAVEGLHAAWVKEAVDKGMKLLDDGKLAQASAWLEMTKEFVWSADIQTRRRIEETVSAIADGRVTGVVVQLGAVRVVKPEDARVDLVRQISQKLSDEGFLPIVLASRTEAKAAEIARVLVVDYREERSGTFTSENREKANGTRVTCSLKLVSAKDNKTLWQGPGAITAQTGTVGGLRTGEFNDANLRLDALRRFYIELDTVRIPSRDNMP